MSLTAPAQGTAPPDVRAGKSNKGTPSAWPRNANRSTAVYRSVVGDRSLSDRAFRLMILLDGEAGDRTYCRSTQEDLERLSGKSARPVQKIVAELRRAGWIKSVHREIRGDRYGFILLRRVGPGTAAANSPEKIAQAEADLRRGVAAR